LSLEALRRVNLIAGSNGCGKTTLLEALFVHVGSHNPYLVKLLANLRGIQAVKLEFGQPSPPLWNSLFRDLNESVDIRMTGRHSQSRTSVLTVSATSDPEDLAKVRLAPNAERRPIEGASAHVIPVPLLRWIRSGDFGDATALYYFDGTDFTTISPTLAPPLFPGRILTSRQTPNFREIAEQFGDLVIHRQEDELLKVLGKIEPKLRGLRTVLSGSEPMLYADLGAGPLLPAALLGDGILRLTRIVLAIIQNAGGIVLVDEVENGFHYSHLVNIWRAIGEAASRFNVQFFATTHSRECIAAAHEAFSAAFDYDFALHRLDRTPEGIRAVTYDQEALSGALDFGFEVR
jgi:energy-coupling factor transporter ATP-binding protein EcfA2